MQDFKNKISVIFPGSFDPLTLGHLDIIHRASSLFNRVIILLLSNTTKTSLFSFEERLSITKSILKNLQQKEQCLNVEVQIYNGLTAEYCRLNKIKIILRGIRSGNDLDYETPIAEINKKLNSKLETLFLSTSPKYSFISSTIAKEMARYGRSELKDLVPNEYYNPMIEKFSK